MGLILCNKHGGQGFFEICEHIQADLNNGIYPTMIKFPIFNVKVCQDCYDNISAHEIPDISLDELFSNYSEQDIDKIDKSVQIKYNQINRSAICTICNLEHKLIYARKQGQEDPFEAFENTLTFIQQHTIDELEEYLLKNYNFLPSIVTEDQKALSITTGNIAKPLLITIYYITAPEEQNKVIQLIDNFFSSQKLTQRRIHFFEKENWIEKQEKTYTSHHRGEEQLIRDIIIQ